jgi:hypothetical protein
MLGAVLFVLLIAYATSPTCCSSARTRETGIRLCLGATRGALERRCLAESVILSSI